MKNATQRRTEMATEIAFGIGTLDLDGREAVAIVVDDQVATLADVARGRRPPLQPVAAMRDFMPEWERWHEWLRSQELQPSPGEGWRPLREAKFKAPVPEPWNIFSTYHNFERPSRVTGKSDP